jgi:hypothetical protein
MMRDALSLKHYKTLKIGDPCVFFTAAEVNGSNTIRIDGEPWFYPGHNPDVNDFNGAAQELYRLRDRFRPKYPGFFIRLNREQGKGSLNLPCPVHRIIVLGFIATVMDEERYRTLHARIAAIEAKQ